ncbi:MAG TPA: RND transporter, partial [Myxococcota bacterium]
MRIFVALSLSTLASLAACSVGPDYVRPDAPVPKAFKEQAGWKVAEPAEADSKSTWWSIYDDKTLDDLERQVDVSNQNLKAAEAAYRFAKAAIDGARAGFFPTLGV